MLSTLKKLNNSTYEISFSSRSIRHGLYKRLTEALSSIDYSHKIGFIANLGNASLSSSTMSELIEFSTQNFGGIHFAIYGINPDVQRKLSRNGLDLALPIYPNQQSILASKVFAHLALQGCRAVILCAGVEEQSTPICGECPNPMLDFFGKPIAEHILQHFVSYGIRDVRLNPAVDPQLYAKHFNNLADPSVVVSLYPEGSQVEQRWHPKPLGQLKSLGRLDREFCAFNGDTFVALGNSLSKINLKAMMDAHQAEKADLTVATATLANDIRNKTGTKNATTTFREYSYSDREVPQSHNPTSKDAGLYIFSKALLEKILLANETDITSDLCKTLKTKGFKVCFFETTGKAYRIDSAENYFSTISDALTQTPRNVLFNARKVGDCWQSDSAQVSKFASIVGPVFIGPGAEIHAGSSIVGPSVIGENCVVEAGCLIKHSVVAPNTQIPENTIVESKIIHPGGITPIFSDHQTTVFSTQLHPEDIRPRLGGLNVQAASA